MQTRPKLLAPDPLPTGNRRKLIDDTARTLGADVPGEAARGFLYLTILPPSQRWMFLSLGKNASTTTLRLLFELEYGHRLSARFTPTHDINPSAVVHKLADSGVFGRALTMGLDAEALLALPAERLLVVRNPYERAVSSFRYFCKSDEMGAGWFLNERLRATAMVGFDWDTMPGTIEGLRRFLRYLAAEIDQLGPYALNSHWCIQARLGFPKTYRPTLLGRVEALAEFYEALADRLGQKLPDEIALMNRQQPAPDTLTLDPEARRLVEQVYADDFEAFGY